MNTAIKILIDNGHGYNTPGKASPDKSLREWAWTREVARRIVAILKEHGHDAELLVPEDYDIMLTKTEYLYWNERMGSKKWSGRKAVRHRVGRVNDMCRIFGNKNVLCVSVHNNASGNGKDWYKAKGWLSMVSQNSSRESRMLCDCLMEEALKTGLNTPLQYADRSWWVKSLAITRETNCPAVLTENGFMDNKEECAWLLSEKGKETIVNLHVNAIEHYINKMRSV